jgi:hypothetical protein
MIGLTFETLLRHSLTVVSAGITIGGVVVSTIHLNLSKWMWLLVLGFVVECIAQVASAAAVFWIQRGGFIPGFPTAVFLIPGAVGTLGWLLIVGGLWGVFSDVQRRLAT